MPKALSELEDIDVESW